MIEHNLKAQSVQIKSHKHKLQNNAHKHKFNSNYHPSVAREDSNSIESTYIFPEILKQKS